MKLPKPISLIPTPTKEQLAALAERCEYIGSVEHKNQKSWLGLPRPRKGIVDDTRQTATICPLVSDSERSLATNWTRIAVQSRQFNAKKWKGDFPRYIWYRDKQGNYWYGFLTEQGAGDNPKGQYKGWPISEEEWREDFC